jgi:hypothetical protein
MGRWLYTTIELTPWSKVHQKLTVTQVVKKFPAFLGTQSFITIFTRAHHWSLYQARLIWFSPSYPISLKINSSITVPSTPMLSTQSLPFRFSNQNFVCISHLSHSSYPPWLNHHNNTWCSLHVMKLLIMQSCSASCHFLPLRSIYSPQYHPVLLLAWQTKFHTHIQNR